MAEEQTTQEKSTEQIASENRAQTQNMMVPGAIVVAGIIIAGAIIFSGGGNGGSVATGPTGGGGGGAAEQPEAPTNEELLALAAITDDDYVFGNRDAEVYILEFSDTECPFCKRFHQTVHDIVDEYDGEVAWVYRHFPLVSLHRKAEREAQALECAGELGGNDGFWAYTDRLYEITPSNDGLLDSQLPEIATFVGLDAAAFTECLDSGRHAQAVADDLQNAIDLGGRGTPHSLIIAGDEIIPLQGAQPFDNVKAVIDSVL